MIWQIDAVDRCCPIVPEGPLSVVEAVVLLVVCRTGPGLPEWGLLTRWGVPVSTWSRLVLRCIVNIPILSLVSALRLVGGVVVLPFGAHGDLVAVPSPV